MVMISRMPAMGSTWLSCVWVQVSKEISVLLVHCLIHEGFEKRKMESLLMQTTGSCFGLFGLRQCSCSA